MEVHLQTSMEVWVDKNNKKERWEEMITSIDLTHNSRKAWKTIKSIVPTTPTPPCLLMLTKLHTSYLSMEEETQPKRPIITIAQQGEQSLVYLFTEAEDRKVIATLYNNKAVSIDDVLVDQLMNLGRRAHRW